MPLYGRRIVGLLAFDFGELRLARLSALPCCLLDMAHFGSLAYLLCFVIFGFLELFPGPQELGRMICFAAWIPIRSTHLTDLRKSINVPLGNSTASISSTTLS